MPHDGWLPAFARLSDARHVAVRSQMTAGRSFAVARAGHTQGICTPISHRTATDWPREHRASITASPLAAGGRAFVHHDECYHWRRRGPDSCGTPGLAYLLIASGIAVRTLTQQPVDDAGRRTRQAERQRHAHQRLVAIEFGWWRAQRVLAVGRFNSSTREKCRRCSVPDLGGFSPFLCRFGSRDTQIPAQAMGMVIKIVMIQRLFKFSLSLK